MPNSSEYPFDASRGRMQTITVEDAPPMPGDCFRAAVATVLDLPVGKVPHFVALGHYWWLWAFNAWCAGRGLRYDNVLARGVTPDSDVLHIRSGVSPRGVNHAVVAIGGEMVFDPHPSGAGLVPRNDDDFMFIWSIDDLAPFEVIV